MRKGIAAMLGLFLMLEASTALAELVRCEGVFANALSANSFSLMDKAFNTFYLVKKPKLLKQLDVNEYVSYLAMLRENRQDISASKIEHYIAILDHHNESVGVQFHQLPVLTQKKIGKALTAYLLAKGHDSKDMIQFVNTLTDGTMEKPVSLFRVVELMRRNKSNVVLLKQYSEQFILMNAVSDLFMNYGKKTSIDEAKFGQLRKWYRRNSEYVSASLMSSVQFAFNIIDPGGVYMSGINLMKIEAFQSHVELGLKKNLSAEEMLSRDRYLRDMMRSDMEYRVVQSTVNTTFWISLIYFLFSDE